MANAIGMNKQPNVMSYLQVLKREFAPLLRAKGAIPQETVNRFNKAVKEYKKRNPRWRDTDIEGHEQTETVDEHHSVVIYDNVITHGAIKSF